MQAKKQHIYSLKKSNLEQPYEAESRWELAGKQIDDTTVPADTREDSPASPAPAKLQLR